ncbi:molybdopterin-dependent oxidoreductase [Actinoplanes couchii]|uniref:molybdopterin-dependent oxidoreductase n=1 Tax=Actinoplanes couchii TaxID=403638 RepID=UPI001EF1803B|nr:molybdopterin-dependent oxidoreductase [Actinoplanes couchii]MDR6317257.1 hypothetical protein [Actinoplanes couchii]
MSSWLGLALGVAFGVCFVTGLLSHLVQHPPGWFGWPSRPVGLYRFTQGLHVATGLASVPLLGAKLWSVYPRLFQWPPARSVVHAAERVSVAVLVAAALFQVVGGVLNVGRWYAPMPFFFTAAHYWVGWLVIGALLVHIGVQLPVVRAALARPVPQRPGDRAGTEGEPMGEDEPVSADVAGGDVVRGDVVRGDVVRGDVVRGDVVGGLSRRGILGGVAVAAGLVTVTSVGQTAGPLSPLVVLVPRRPDDGPQGLPVNRTADRAGVRDLALGPAYRLTVAAPGREIGLGLDALHALVQHTVELPISCVEGWSATGLWSGVRLRDLVALVGTDPDRAAVEVESLEAAGRYRTSVVAPEHTRDPLTLIALRLGGEPLHLDHGYPARLIAPNRPGVMQTKWLGRITVRELR